MSAPTRPPGPGRIVEAILTGRLSAQERSVLESELLELYEHRRGADGPVAADRWLRREYRRWAFRILTGRGPAGAPGGRGGGGGGFLMDVRHAARGLLGAPTFSATLTLTVGLGIGGTTLLFAIVHAVLVSPLPYPGSERMVLLRTVNGADMWGTSMADLVAVYEPPPAFEAIAAYTYRTPSIAVGDGAEIVRSKWVTTNYFPMLGIEPVHGRGFDPAESRPGAPRVTLVTESFWARAFEGPFAPGSALVVDGEPYEVVGVLPDALGPLDRIAVFPALVVETPPRKGPFFYSTIGRLAPDVDPAVAREQLDAIARQQFPIWRDSFTAEQATLGFVDLKQILVGDTTRPLLLLSLAVGLLLAIATTNAASLLVSRGIARAHEVGIRAALGASTGRLYRLLLTESGLLALAGSLMGVALTVVGSGFVRTEGLGRLPRAQEVGLTPEVVGFLTAVTVASWALFGLVAAVVVLRQRTDTLAGSAARTTQSRGLRTLRRGLVAAQFVICVPLLVGAGLMARSLDRLQDEELGFDPEGVVSMLVTLPTQSYPDPERMRAFWDGALESIERLPDVSAVALTNGRPPVVWTESNNFELADRPSEPGEVTQAPWITVDSRYFATLGIPFVEGRGFNDPRTDTMRTAVVDQAFVERFFPGQSALGRRMRSGGCTVDGCPWIEIVGVVANVKTTGLDDGFGTGTVYYDFRRSTQRAMNLHVRARGAPLAVIPAVRRALAAIDPGVPTADVSTVHDLIEESLLGRRYTGLLVALLGAVALLLSVVGIYGTTVYFVRQHAREIGIRLALGGSPASALTLVVGQGLAVAAVGTVVGVVFALGLSGWVSGVLYEVSATDPLVFGSVAALTLLVALCASLVPGRAAAATDPAVTLRGE